jgi:hypothetical protein
MFENLRIYYGLGQRNPKNLLVGVHKPEMRPFLADGVHGKQTADNGLSEWATRDVAYQGRENRDVAFPGRHATRQPGHGAEP